MRRLGGNGLNNPFALSGPVSAPPKGIVAAAQKRGVGAQAKPRCKYLSPHLRVSIVPGGIRESRDEAVPRDRNRGDGRCQDDRIVPGIRETVPKYEQIRVAGGRARERDEKRKRKKRNQHRSLHRHLLPLLIDNSTYDAASIRQGELIQIKETDTQLSVGRITGKANEQRLPGFLRVSDSMSRGGAAIPLSACWQGRRSVPVSIRRDTRTC